MHVKNYMYTYKSRHTYVLHVCQLSNPGHAGLLHKRKSYGISGQIFGLISSFLSNRQLRVVLDGKSSQEYPVKFEVPPGSIFGSTLFLLYISEIPDNVICDIVIYADDTNLYSKCDQATDL